MLLKHPGKYTFENPYKQLCGTDCKTIRDESKDMSILNFDRYCKSPSKSGLKILTPTMKEALFLHVLANNGYYLYFQFLSIHWEKKIQF